MTGSRGISIVEYRAQHRAAFRDLNLAWIERYFTVEPRDVRDLGDPERYVIAPGGLIVMAEYDGIPVGTCALLLLPSGDYELAKMAVAESARGQGVGRALAEAVIARARAMHIEQLELFTNTSLEPAVRLYRSLGFVDAPLEHSEYGRANLRMILTLDPTMSTRA